MARGCGGFSCGGAGGGFIWIIIIIIQEIAKLPLFIWLTEVNEFEIAHLLHKKAAS